jgi:nucleoside-diphosphate-sugar epimerase
MDILIIGGTGFLGSYMRNYLSSKHSVDYTYASQKHEDQSGFIYQAGKDSLCQILNKRYDIIINNINPLSLTYNQVVTCIEDLILFCDVSNTKIIHISSVSALYENRFANSYNLKKAIAEDLIRAQIPEENYAILRFTQLFDDKGLSRTSQTGLYYLLKEIKNQKPISIFSNNKECYRNYMPVELAIRMIETIINKNFCGIFNAHLDRFTLSFDELILKLTRLNKNYNSKKLISIGDKIGLKYFIAPQSNELSSTIDSEINLMSYFVETYNRI